MALEAVKKESELPVDFDYQYMVPAIKNIKNSGTSPQSASTINIT